MAHSVLTFNDFEYAIRSKRKYDGDRFLFVEISNLSDFMNYELNG